MRHVLGRGLAKNEGDKEETAANAARSHGHVDNGSESLMGRRGLALRCNIESRGHNAKLDAGSVLRPRTLCWGVGGGMVVLERVVSVKACRAFHPCDPVGEAG